MTGHAKSFRTVFHVPVGTTREMENWAAARSEHTDKSPNGPLYQRGRAAGPGDFDPGGIVIEVRRMGVR